MYCFGKRLHLRSVFGRSIYPKVTSFKSFSGHKTKKKLNCIDLSELNSDKLNSLKDPKDEAFSMKNISFRPKV